VDLVTVGSAAAPAVGSRIIDFEFELAAEPAEDVNPVTYLSYRHLRAFSGHGGA
jgi:hypothetical protein